jgi:hypothetical protein
MNERQQKFIRALAKFLTENEAEMSVKLQFRLPEAKQWMELRSATPLFGYYPGEEGLNQAEDELTRFLYGN